MYVDSFFFWLYGISRSMKIISNARGRRTEWIDPIHATSGNSLSSSSTHSNSILRNLSTFTFICKSVICYPFPIGYSSRRASWSVLFSQCIHGPYACVHVHSNTRPNTCTFPIYAQSQRLFFEDMHMDLLHSVCPAFLPPLTLFPAVYGSPNADTFTILNLALIRSGSGTCLENCRFQLWGNWLSRPVFEKNIYPGSAVSRTNCVRSESCLFEEKACNMH